MRIALAAAADVDGWRADDGQANGARRRLTDLRGG